jgi:tetratricopeptide (TPR) repeat protein
MIGYSLWGIKTKSVFSFLIAFFFITLLLSSNLILKIAATFGERFLYVPSLGFCIALPVIFAKMLKPTLISSSDSHSRKLSGIKSLDYSFYIPMAGLLIIYTIIVIPRNTEWKNNLALFSSGITISPNSGRTHGALANTYMDSASATANHDKKLIFYSLGRMEYEKAIVLYSLSDDFYFNLGLCYEGDGYGDSAIVAYKKTLDLNPKYSGASNNLGVIYYNKAQYDSALHYFEMSYKYDTNSVFAVGNIGVIYQLKGNIERAKFYYQKALSIEPGNKVLARNLEGLK